MKIPATVSSLLLEWRQSSWIRLGGWLIIAIILTYGLLLLSDWEDTLKAEYSDMAGRVGRLEALTAQSDWSVRAKSARALRVQMEGRLWRAESRGLAHAMVQTWLDTLLKKVQIVELRIHVDPAVDVSGHDGVWQVTAKVEGKFDSRKLADLLYAIETHPQLATVEQMDVFLQRNRHFTLVLKTYFQARST